MLALNDVHQAKAKRALADLYIRPPVEEFNILDFGDYERIAEIGYESGREALASWPRLASAQGGTGAANSSLAAAAKWAALAECRCRELDATLERLSEMIDGV